MSKRKVYRVCPSCKRNYSGVQCSCGAPKQDQVSFIGKVKKEEKYVDVYDFPNRIISLNDILEV